MVVGRDVVKCELCEDGEVDMVDIGVCCLLAPPPANNARTHNNANPDRLARAL